MTPHSPNSLHKEDPLLPGQSDQLLWLLQVHGHGLLKEDVLTRLKHHPKNILLILFMGKWVFFITLPPGSGTDWPAQHTRCPHLCPGPEENIPPPPSRRWRARRTRGPCQGTCEGKGCSCCPYCFDKKIKKAISCTMFFKQGWKRALHNLIWGVRKKTQK